MMRNVDVARRMRAGAAAVACAAMLAGGLTVAANAEDAAAYEANDAASLAAALTCGGSTAARTVTITGDITVEPKDLSDASTHITCPVTIVSDGLEMHTITWTGGGSMLWPQASGSLTIGVENTAYNQGGNALTFTHPDDGNTYGPLMHSYGTVTIHGGTFTGLRVDRGGVVLNGDDKTGGDLTIDGGLFKGNTASGKGGGVVFQSKGSTAITGGTFEDNVASPAGCSEQTADTTCMKGGQGGGAVRTEAGSLTVRGGAVFRHNGATAADFRSGGGAIWAKGTLAIKNGEGGVKPLFEDNWATIADPGDRNIAEDGILRGGAGGAVFLDGGGSTAYFTGGEYKDNVSGYLGGAVYTEENSTSYVGKAVAWSNIAGHFGGGLWFCPSGNSAASKGGNIALFDNLVEAKYDANPDNKVTPLPDGADTTVAGDDLAIMNPSWKAIHGWAKDTNQFQLLDTWFTDRSTPAVSWEWNNTPLKESSGYQDSWLPETSWGDTKVNQGIRAVLASTQTNKDRTQDAGLLTLSSADPTPEGAIGTGLALKAKVLDENREDAVKSAAQLTFTGNSARLSGGAFGSDGVVIFDSPYSVDWNKTDADTGNKVSTASTWLLTATKLDARTDGGATPYFDTDMRPSDCEAGDDTKADCWGHDNPETAETETDANTWYVRITDNDSHDNNKDFGSLSLDNLAPGTYTLKETVAPTGYVKTDVTYEFTITPTAAGHLPAPPKLTPVTTDSSADKAEAEGTTDIPNEALKGVLAWSKTDSETNAEIGGSTWKIVKTDNGNESDIKDYTDIADCKADKAEDCKGPDTDPKAGRFSLKLGGELAEGSYELVETGVPDGYLKPTNAKHPFTVSKSADGTEYTVAWGKDENGNIANTPTAVSWMKVGSDDTSKALAGSTWKLTDKDGKDVYGHDITDCVKQDACTADDRDSKPGVFRLIGLKAGEYTLTEQTAPDGYVKSTVSYTFTISTDKEETVKIDGATGDDNAIVNAKQMVALPLTGGSALDWLVTGGVLALLALASALVMNRMRGRAGVR
ncbi:SpaA isopeptide-forming pilin-related protein [Bifidobacterium sp. SO4]|uniref:MSCRAMM family protein n=1 Tax=Bifidobacterium sp. SO4 TaxID=2809030 RepID=UPI001BDC7080|nr:SpaA isopeptide-forming pilin-related protein [Bifidobacterium sp. SO4]MBT1170659.1 hypothetical protein [Bifidobacterium sp. SO4]